MAPHVEVVILDMAKDCFIILVCTSRTCALHLSLVSIWTPRILISAFGFMFLWIWCTEADLISVSYRSIKYHYHHHYYTSMPGVVLGTLQTQSSFPPPNRRSATSLRPTPTNLEIRWGEIQAAKISVTTCDSG